MTAKTREFHVALREADRSAAVIVDAVDAAQAVRMARKLIPWAGSVMSVSVRCSGRVKVGLLGIYQCKRWTVNGYCCAAHKPEDA